jgi:hypothetical protein
MLSRPEYCLKNCRLHREIRFWWDSDTAHLKYFSLEVLFVICSAYGPSVIICPPHLWNQQKESQRDGYQSLSKSYNNVVCRENPFLRRTQ